ncbi:MAG: hypothetical protein IKK30_07375 [Clostridia bacterium]|nr:hypothetical protein [Clostridia bacterium]
MNVVSLIVLIAVIAAAFIFKVNTGLAAIMASLVLVFATGTPEKFILSAFDSKMFLMLFGVMYLFCIAQENKTLDVLARKVLTLCKGNAKIFPIILFLLGAVLSAVGPGPISITALMAAIIVALAKQTGCTPISLLPFGALGAFAGGLSPITPSGIVAVTKATESGIEGIAGPLNLKMALINAVFAAVLYFFVFKWHKFKVTPTAAGAEEKVAPFTAKQWATLGGIAAVAVMAFLGINVGLAAISVAVILTIFRCADEVAALKKVSWGTLLMITGVGILISLVTELGGIDLLCTGLQKLVGPATATSIMCLLGGVMSWFSSASGVVMPTLIPTVPALTASMAAGSDVIVTVAICIGAHFAAMSPLSSCGGLMLAAYSSSGETTAKDRNRTFLQLFGISAGGLGLATVLALIESLIRTLLG